MNIIRFLHRKTDEHCTLYDYKTVRQALCFMRSHGYTEMPVINQDGAYLGVVGEGDFLWHIIDCGGFDAVKDDKIIDVLRNGMVPALKITATDEELQKAIEHCSFIPIVDDRDVFVGIVYREDVLQYFAEQAKEAMQDVTA